MHNVQGTQKMVSNQTGNRLFATSIFAILVDFVFKFWYEPLEWCQKYTSVKSHFCQKCLCEILSRCHLNYHDAHNAHNARSYDKENGGR